MLYQIRIFGRSRGELQSWRPVFTLPGHQPAPRMAIDREEIVDLAKRFVGYIQ